MMYYVVCINEPSGVYCSMFLFMYVPGIHLLCASSYNTVVIAYDIIRVWINRVWLVADPVRGGQLDRENKVFPLGW